MINPKKMIEMQNAGKQFIASHPKFLPFWKAVGHTALKEGTVVEFKVTTPEGKVLESNLKLSASDVSSIQKVLSYGQK